MMNIPVEIVNYYSYNSNIYFSIDEITSYYSILLLCYISLSHYDVEFFWLHHGHALLGRLKGE